MLRLTIIETPDDEKPQGNSIVVGPAGATVGRAPENTWTLPDSESLVSRTHFEILFEDGGYSLHDRSTNGSFVNEEQQPVGRGKMSPLHDGDLIRLGNYSIKVNLEAVGHSPGPDLGERPAFLGRGAQEQAPSSETPAPLIPEPEAHEAVDTAGLPGAFADIQPQQVPDILIGDGGAAPREILAATGGLPEDEHALGEWRDIGDGFPGPDAGGIHFTPPPTNPIPAAVPSADDNANIPGNGFGVADPVPPAAGSGGNGIIPDDWYLKPEDAVSTMPDEMSPPPVAAPPPVSTPVQAPVQAPPAPPTPVAAPADGTGLEASIRQAVSGALGSQAQALSLKELVRVVEEMAAMAAVSSPELMKAMSARTQAKDHLRLHRTMIEAQNNNPLKFSDNPQDALRHMLLNDQPRLLQGRLAVAEAFRELAAHQTALIAALQPALQETVERFSPAVVEAAAKTEAAGGFSLASGKGRLWDTYTRIYDKLTKSDRGRLEQHFMAALSEQYERILNTLK